VTALVVGYGNPLRGDDGVGWLIAGRLADDPRMAGTEILQRHQLTPELALDISRAERVVLVDARSDALPGTVTTGPLGLGDEGSSAWSHHVGPAGLVALARTLYGRVPDVHVVGIGVASLEVGAELSPAVAAALDPAIEAIVALVLDPEPAPGRTIEAGTDA
jgi:hydrogenase maturation protease